MMPQDPYLPPVTPPTSADRELPTTTPGVVHWFRAYAIFTAVLALTLVGVGVFFLLPGTRAIMEDSSEMELRIMGYVYGIIGAFTFIVFLLPLFLPRHPGTWVYDLVIICLGMTGCTIVFSIPLLIFWIKPETKAYFGMKPAV